MALTTVDVALRLLGHEPIDVAPLRPLLEDEFTLERLQQITVQQLCMLIGVAMASQMADDFVGALLQVSNESIRKIFAAELAESRAERDAEVAEQQPVPTSAQPADGDHALLVDLQQRARQLLHAHGMSGALMTIEPQRSALFPVFPPDSALRTTRSGLDVGRVTSENLESTVHYLVFFRKLLDAGRTILDHIEERVKEQGVEFEIVTEPEVEAVVFDGVASESKLDS